MNPLDAVTEDANVTGTFVNEENEINKKSTISLAKILKGKNKPEKKVM